MQTTTLISGFLSLAAGFSLEALFAAIASPFAFVLYRAARRIRRRSTRPLRSVSGRPRVVDGDTVVINGTRFRLFGIDAPEMSQPVLGRRDDAGELAKRALIELIGDRTVDMTPHERDVYQRVVATAHRDGKDLGYNLVYRGFAVAVADAPDPYHDAERDARAERRGLWKLGGFKDPSSYRA